MKRFLAIIMAIVTIASLNAPIMAMSNDTLFEEYDMSSYDDTVSFTDASGTEYFLAMNKDDDSITVSQYNKTDDLVSESTLDLATGIITTRTPQSTSRSTGQPQSYRTTMLTLSDYTRGTSSPASVAAKSFDSDQYDSSDVYWLTGRTDFIYQGEILTGKCYYRYSGYYTEGESISYSFVRGTALTVVATALSGLLQNAAPLTIVLAMLKDWGISVVQDVITGEFDPMVETRRYDITYKAKMKPYSSYITISKIDKFVDFACVSGGPNEFSKYVNMFSYTDEDSALTGGCSEALGYAGYAFEAKYITGSYPNLSLPVSGPRNTWDI